MVDSDGRGLMCAALSPPTPHPCHTASNMAHLQTLKPRLANHKTSTTSSATIIQVEVATAILTALAAAGASTTGELLAAAEMAMRCMASIDPMLEPPLAALEDRVVAAAWIFPRLALVLEQRGQSAAVAQMLNTRLHWEVKWQLNLQAARDWAATVHQIKQQIASLRTHQSRHQYAFTSLTVELSHLSQLVDDGQMASDQLPPGQQPSDAAFSRGILYAAVELGNCLLVQQMLTAAQRTGWPGLAFDSEGSALLTLAIIASPTGRLDIFEVLLEAVAAGTPVADYFMDDPRPAEDVGQSRVTFAVELEQLDDARYLFAFYASTLRPAEWDWVFRMDPAVMSYQKAEVVSGVMGLVFMLMTEAASQADSMVVVPSREGVLFVDENLFLAVLHACALDIEKQQALAAEIEAQIMQGHDDRILQIALRMHHVGRLRDQLQLNA